MLVGNIRCKSWVRNIALILAIVGFWHLQKKIQCLLLSTKLSTMTMLSTFYVKWMHVLRLAFILMCGLNVIKYLALKPLWIDTEPETRARPRPPLTCPNQISKRACRRRPRLWNGSLSTMTKRWAVPQSLRWSGTTNTIKPFLPKSVWPDA